MRKIEKTVCGAFVSGLSASQSNTYTTGEELYLHGHKIAYRDINGNIFVSNCGWETRTTQSRINAVCRLLGMRSKAFTKNFDMYIENMEGDNIPFDGYVQIWGEAA